MTTRASEKPLAYVGAGGGLHLAAYLLGLVRKGKGARLASHSWSAACGLGFGALLPAALAQVAAGDDAPEVFRRLEELLKAVLGVARRLFAPVEGTVDFLDRLAPWSGGGFEGDELQQLLRTGVNGELLRTSPCAVAVAYYLQGAAQATPQLTLALNDAAWRGKAAVEKALQHACRGRPHPPPVLLRMGVDVPSLDALSAALRRPGLCPGAEDYDAAYDASALVALTAAAAVFSKQLRFVSAKPWAILPDLATCPHANFLRSAAESSTGAVTVELMTFTRRAAVTEAASSTVERLTAAARFSNATMQFFEPEPREIPSAVRSVFFPFSILRTLVDFHCCAEAFEAAAAEGDRAYVNLVMGRGHLPARCSSRPASPPKATAAPQRKAAFGLRMR